MSGSFALTPADIERLVNDPSVESRAEVANNVARDFGNQQLSDAERSLAGEIIGLMLRDTEVRVRKMLAENLRENPNLPRDLALRMAKDVSDVAMPVLQSSPVFSDDDLLQIVRSNSGEHQAAIAGRSSVSARISSELVERGDQKVVKTLMANNGAKVDEKTFGRALDRFGADESVTAVMAGRHQVPAGVSERLISLVSENIKAQLMARTDISPEIANDIVLQSRERALISALGASERVELEQMLTDLKRRGRLTPSLVLRALCAGDLDFFETAIAILAGLPVANAHQLIHDPGRRGLEAVYKRCNLPMEMLPVAQVAIDVASETQYDGGPADRERFVSRVIERVLTHFEGTWEGDDVDWLITRLGSAAAAARKAAGVAA